MKYLLYLVLIILFPAQIILGQEKGIQFIEGLNWQQVKEKAKKENKYILIDCFTSWCGPCKVMDASVFKNDSVSTIANEKFIAVKVQFDDDKAKIPLKKEWFNLSKTFTKNYNVTGYPTILFFNPDGEIVHKVVGLRRVPSFAKTLENVTNPDYQYYSSLDNYKKDSNNLEILHKLVYTAQDADELLPIYIDNYLQKSNGINSEKDAQLVFDMTHASKGKTFPLLSTDIDKINKYLGEGKAEELFRGIIYYEEFKNTLGRNSAMSYYISNPNPDWNSYQQLLQKKYPQRIDEVMDYAKLNFYAVAHQWDKYVPELKSYREKYKNSISDKMKVEYASNLALNVKDLDRLYLEDILKWSEKAFDKSDNPTDKLNYAILLYENEQQNKAVEIMTENIKKISTPEYTVYPEFLKKMQMGAKL